MFPLLAALVLGAAILNPALAFLPTKLNYSDPEVIATFCPSLMSGETWDHKAITREAIRREIRRFFLEVPPITNETFFIPEDATLSQIFRYYYGPTSSPARFIKAVNSITWANAMTEASGQIRFETQYHMDAEKINEGHILLQGRYQQLTSTITNDEAYPFARELLGTSLNSIQDFYSQTTWVELGNKNILKELGFPGQMIPEVAGPGDTTCTDCPDPQGECLNNVIPGSKLSSGYYEYDVPGSASFVVPKPENAGKCGHGGLMDLGVSKMAIGGINKETSSPCFSPHHYLHQQAVDLAISASEHYLSILRDAVGDEHFRHLFDLYAGSALSIMIDTTGSMTGEISAVKEEARLIVEKTHPEMFVLTPFKDPNLGPVTATADSELFLEELDELDAYGGCCCTEENFWAALELALAHTPDYSSVYCFTDAGGNDKQFMEGSIALATAKHCQVTVIFSFDQTSPPSRVGDQFCPEDEYILTGVEEYKRLAAETGGQFIEIDKFDIEDIIGILEDGVEESEVAIRMRDGVNGSQTLDFPVDDSINYFQVLIVGEITSSTLTDGELTFDLMDGAGLEGQAGVEIITLSPSLKSIKFANLTVGIWTLQVHSDTEEFSASVSALSTLGFFAEFCELVLLPPRPSYRIIRGRPLMEHEYYIEVTLVGYVDSRVQSVVSMDLVDKKGVQLSHVEYKEAVDDHFFIRSEVLPSTPFFIQIDGFLETGSPFSRIFPTMVVPVKCAVELVVEMSTLSARAGETVTANFRVTNYGPLSDFDYYASDEELYITNWVPKTSTIDAQGYIDIVVTFSVPPSAVPGTVSTVTVTAASKVDASNVNSAITYFLVLPEEQDFDSPLCSTSDEPDCAGFTDEVTCADKTWSVVATLQDTLSGLSRISSTPAENLTVAGFVEGTTDPVTATLTTTCCVKNAEIIGVDGQGNVGKCQWEMPRVEIVLEFVAESVGQTWVNLRWTVNEVRDDLDKYTIITNDDFSTDSGCRDVTCFMNVTFLDPCTLHHFQLNPYFGGTKGPDYFTENTTLPEAATAPINPSTEYTSETTTTISWEGTMDPACLIGYEVCYKRIDSMLKVCFSVTETSATLENLEACTIYFVEITTVVITGERSEPLEHTTQTDEAAPGRPENLHMVNQTGPYAEIAWDDPLTHASCVHKWIVAHRPLNTTFDGKNGPKDTNGTTFFTFTDLLGCNLYEYSVSGVSPAGLPGATAFIYDETEEMSPKEVESVVATAVSPTQIEASWTPPEIKACLDHYEVCIVDTNAPSIECYDTYDIAYSFTDLNPCVYYQIAVASVSINGLESAITSGFATTDDIPSGTPTALAVSNLTAHSAVISYSPPEENPNCVSEYDFRVINFDEVKKTKNPTKEPIAVLADEFLENLEACTNYGIYIASVTVSGFVSEEANVNFTTLIDTPSEPRELQSEGSTQNSVDLTWFAPEINGACAVSYYLAWTSGTDNGDVTFEEPTKPFVIHKTVESLTACSAYSFSVSAVTSTGDYSDPVSIEASTLC